jgi:hypothetical protein
MRRQELLKKISHCCRVFMITLLLLVALIFIKSCIVEASGFFLFRKDFSYREPQSQTKPLDHQWRIERSLRMFLPDGTVHLAYSDYQLPESQRVRIFDLNDNLLWQGKEEELPEKYLKWPGYSAGFLHTYTLRYTLRNRHNIYPDPRRSIIVPVPGGKNIESLWRYENSGGYFVGFDLDGNRIGFFGSAGFAREKPRIKPLEQPENLITWIPVQGGGPIMLWQTEHRIYQIDFGKQVVDLLLQLPDKKIRRMEVQGWMELSPYSEMFHVSEEYRPMILCRTEDNTHFAILRDPAEVIQIKMPEDSRAWISNVTATREKIYMRAFDSSMNPPKEIARNPDAYIKWIRERRKEPTENTEELYQVDSNGHITLLNKFEWTRQPRQQGIDYREKLRRLLSKTSPAFYDIFGGFFYKLIKRPLYDRDLAFYQLFHIFLHFAPSYNPVGYLLSVLMAGIVFFHARPRRTSPASLIGWIIFTALFNIVGLLVYLALNYTPTIQCHKCNKRRGLSTPQCPRCGGDLPASAPETLSIQLSSELNC